MRHPIKPNLNRLVLSITFVIAVPILMISIAVTWAINDVSLYTAGFEKHDVPAATGIQIHDLGLIANQLRNYFNSTSEPLNVRAPVFGKEMPIFNQREISHMRDVKRLIWGTYGMLIVSGLYLIGASTVRIMVHRQSAWGWAMQHSLLGAGCTMAIVLLIALFSLTGFDSTFRTFHEIAFTNDLWQLDPTTDRLILMFPQSFWFDSTMFVGLVTVAQALAIGVASAGIMAIRSHIWHA